MKSNKILVKDNPEIIKEKKILEIAMERIFKQKNSAEPAWNLINGFGSLSKVFNASVGELVKIRGIKRSTAVQICFLNELFYFAEQQRSEKMSVDTTDKLLRFCRILFTNCAIETAFIIFLDPKFNVVHKREVNDNRLDFSSINLKEVIRDSLLCNSNRIIVAHNHPAELPTPSSMDISTTRKIAQLLKDINLNLVDHIIIGTNQGLSVRRIGITTDIWIN